MRPRPAEPTIGTDADAWFTPWRFALLLAVLIVVCFPQVVFGFETFFFRDFSIFGYSLASYQRDCFWRGEAPLWNPLSSCGLPFLAQWNTLCLYPPSLFYLVFPLSWALGVFCLGHMFLAGMGMYFLAHRWTGNRLAASVAGMVFAFNGLSWCALMWPNNIAALGWMPWVVLAAERAWQEGGRRIIWAALIGALQLLAGAPEIIFQTWLVLGALWLLEMARSSSRLRVSLRFAGVAALAGGLAAAQLLPFLDLLLHSGRSAGFADSATDAAKWAMPAGGWANFLVPLFHCYRGYNGVCFQFGQYWTTSYYAGVGTAALALLAVWRVRNARVWLLAGLTFLSLMLALGDQGFFYAGAKQVLPLLGFMRFPVKFVVLAIFALPLLAAFAMNWLRSLPANASPTARRQIWIVTLSLGAAMALIVWRAWAHPTEAEQPATTLRSAALRAVFLTAIAACLVALPRIREPKLRVLARACLLMLFWFDVFTHNANLSPTVERGAYQPDLIRQFFTAGSEDRKPDPEWDRQLQPGESRIMQNSNSVMKMSYRSVNETSTDLFGRRLSLTANLNLLDHIPQVDGFYSLEFPNLHNRVLKAIYTATNELPKLEDFLGVSQVSDPVKAVAWLPRKTFQPLITAGQQPVFQDDETTLRTLLGDTFEPAHQVYLTPEARPFVTATNPVAAKVVSHTFSAQRVEAEVEAAAPAMVVIAQAFYHRWHAYVDGRPVPLWQANCAFQALEMPAGRHQIRLVYEDAAFHAGAVISLGALAACVAAWLVGRKKQAPAQPLSAAPPPARKPARS